MLVDGASRSFSLEEERLSRPEPRLNMHLNSSVFWTCVVRHLLDADGLYAPTQCQNLGPDANAYEDQKRPMYIAGLAGS